MREELQNLGRHVRGRRRGLGLEDRDAELEGGRVQIGDHSATETGPEPVLEPGKVGGRLVGRDDDLLARIDQRIEGMEELFLRVVLADQELQIVDHQDIDAAQLLLELDGGLVADRGNEAVHEAFGRHVDDRGRMLAAPPVELPADRVHQMCLAEADAAVEEQRVEALRGGPLGNPPRAGIGEFVGLADDEALEGEPRLEGYGQLVPHLHSFLRPHPVRLHDRSGALRRRRRRRRGQALRQPAFRQAPFGRSARGQSTADPDIHPADRRVLAVPERVQAIAVMAAHPVAQKPRRQMHRHFVAVHRPERHLAEPGAVFGFPHLNLEPLADAIPLARQHVRTVHLAQSAFRMSRDFRRAAACRHRHPRQRQLALRRLPYLPAVPTNGADVEGSALRCGQVTRHTGTRKKRQFKSAGCAQEPK